MTIYDIKRLGLILSVQAEIEGMKISNYVCKIDNRSIVYYEEDFSSKASEIRNLVYCHDDML